MKAVSAVSQVPPTASGACARRVLGCHPLAHTEDAHRTRAASSRAKLSFQRKVHRAATASLRALSGNRHQS